MENNRKKRPLYCSTGTMVERINNYDWQSAIKNIAIFKGDSLIDGAELMMLKRYYDIIPEITSEINATGVPYPVIHCEKDVGMLISRNEEGDCDAAVEAFKLNCEAGARINAKRMVLHLWGGLPSDSHYEFNAMFLRRLCDIIKPYGIKLLIENIPCTTSDPLTHWRELENDGYLPEVGFIFDTRFGQFHDQIKLILAQDDLWHSGAISHMHISDYGGEYREFAKLRPILHPGEGKIDFFAIAEGLNRLGYEGSITLESPVMDRATLDVIKLQRTLKFVSDVLC